MTPKLFGAALIIFACGGMGISMASVHRQKEQMLQQLVTLVKYMACELQYRQPPLHQLIRSAAAHTSGTISRIFNTLCDELERQVAPDAGGCMDTVLKKIPAVPNVVTEKLNMLGSSLGRFDLSGQLSGLEAVAQLCQRDLDGLTQNRETRLRAYVTLGLCAGSAIVILFL